MKLRSLTLLLTLSALAFAQQRPADLVLLNGKVWTVDRQQPEVQAVAVSGDRIVAVGTTAAMRALAGPGARVVDLKGKRVLPGFIDNHTHFMTGGFQLQSVDLRTARSTSEFARLIAERAAKHPGRWITGGDWDHDAWPGGPLPTKDLIDAATGTTPVFVNRYDGHMALANSHVLKLAGITNATPDPPGGTIVRDPATGEATGVLKDEAMSLVYRIMPAETQDELVEAALLALAEARRFGVTSIQDVSTGAHIRAYQAIRRSGKLTARFHCRIPIGESKSLGRAGLEAPFGDEWVRVGSLKAFADGSLGSSTALFYRPYDSDPSTSGLPSDIVLDGRLATWAIEADKARLQLSIHAIGDSANSLMLDLFDRIRRENPAWDRRFRVEHAQHIHPKDFVRFEQLGVIASVQPYHAIDDGRWAEKRIGHERCRTTYPFRSFLDAGVKLSFGSDWTVGPLDPLLGIYAAVTRRTIDGATPGGWFPDQRISVAEAVEAYTLTNAYAAFEEDEKGSITPGKLADLVVLSDDIFAIDPVKIEGVKVDVTILGGQVVYERGAKEKR